MKFKIIYCTIQSDHILATPEPDGRTEIVNVKTIEALDEYITSKKDLYGHPYKKKKKHGYDYISHAGGVKVERYNKPIIKQIK